MGIGDGWQCEDPQRRAEYAVTTVEALRCIEGKWKIAILCQLFALGTLRLAELERAVDGITQKMLIQQLKQLVEDGIVTRTVYQQVPPKVEYALTRDGREIGPALGALMHWAMARKLRAAGACASPEQA